MKETTEEYIAKLKAGLAALETALYEAKMSAQEVNTRKNKQIAEQQAEIESLKITLSDLIRPKGKVWLDMDAFINMTEQYKKMVAKK